METIGSMKPRKTPASLKHRDKASLDRSVLQEIQEADGLPLFAMSRKKKHRAEFP